MRKHTTTSHTDTDINVGELVETDDEKGLVDLRAIVRDCRKSPMAVARRQFRTLKRMISGWTRLSGLPLTLTRPLPAYSNSSVFVVSSRSRSSVSSQQYLAVGDYTRESSANAIFATYSKHKRTSRSRLLLAEALDALGCGGHSCDWLYRDDCRVEVRSSSACRRLRLQILFPDVLALTPPRLSKFPSRFGKNMIPQAYKATHLF